MFTQFALLYKLSLYLNLLAQNQVWPNHLNFSFFHGNSHIEYAQQANECKNWKNRMCVGYI